MRLWAEWVSCLALASFALFAAPVHAGPPPAAPTEEELAEARRLFFAAVEEQDAARYREALAIYSRVERIAVSPELLFNIGTCHERLGELIAARVAYERAAALAETSHDDEVRGEAGERLRALVAEIPRVRIRLAPGIGGTLTALLDGRRIEPAAFAGFSVDPGEHRIVVRSDRHERQLDVTFPIGAGAERVVDVDLGPRRAAAPNAAAVATPDVGARPSYAPAFVAGGAALALGVGSVVAGVASHGAYARYAELNAHPTAGNLAERDHLRSEGQALQVANAVLVGTAVVAVGAAVYLALKPPGSSAGGTRRAAAASSPRIGFVSW